MHKIQTSLWKRMRKLAELKTIANSKDRVNLPELLINAGNFSVKENVIGEIQYTDVKVLRAQQQTACRNPDKSFKEISQGKFKQSKQIKLKDDCKRISFIGGHIWAAVCGAKCIQVIDVDGNSKREISYPFEPYSVKQAPWGEIIMATHKGLHILCPDGTVESTICSDKFYDVCFWGDEIVGLNSSKKIMQTYRRSGDREWRHSGDIMASQGIGSRFIDCAVTSESEIVFTMRHKSVSHFFKCVGKIGQRMEFSSSHQVLEFPFVCGVDSTGAVLVADHYNKTFQVHDTDDQWSVWTPSAHTGHLIFSMMLNKMLSGWLQKMTMIAFISLN